MLQQNHPVARIPARKPNKSDFEAPVDDPADDGERLVRSVVELSPWRGGFDFFSLQPAVGWSH